MANTFLFTGEEGFLLDKELHTWKTSFAQKYGKDNILIYTPENIDADRLAQDLLGSSLFATKKLCVLYGVPMDTYSPYGMSSALESQLTDMFMQYRDQLGDDVIVVFVARKPDKRKKLYKFLKKSVTKARTFSPVSPSGMLSYILATPHESWTPGDPRGAGLGGYISRDQAYKIIDWTSQNLTRAMKEVAKVLSYMRYHDKTSISDEQLRSLLYISSQDQIFAMIDAVATDPIQAGELLQEMHDNDENIGKVIGMLLRGMRRLLQYVSCVKEGIPTSKIPRVLGVSPYGLKRYAKHAQSLSARLSALWNMRDELISLDAGMKEGVVPPDAVWLRIHDCFYRFADSPCPVNS